MTKWEKNLVLYDEVVAACPDFERKGKTMPYTSENTYMFSFLNKDGEFGIRLPKEAAERFKVEHDSTIFKSNGAIMKDYVLVPDSLLGNKNRMIKYLNESYQYVMSLPPQKGKKK